MTIQQLIEEYQKIQEKLDARWPIEDPEKRIFARTMKLVEEFGELSDAVLTKMKLQRNEKAEEFSPQNVEDEFADVMGTLILLGMQLEVDIEGAIKRKIEFTHERLKDEL